MNVPSPETVANGRRSLRYLLPTALVVCGALLVATGFDIRSVKQWLDQAGPWAPVAFVVIGVALMSIFVPKTAVSIAAGAMFGTLMGSFLMLIIGTAGALVSYLIGRWWLYDSIVRWLDRQQQRSDSEQSTWANAVREIAADGGFGFHMLMRLAPVPTMIISYSMGAAGARLQPFLLAAALGVIPQILWVHGGSAVSLASDPEATPLRWLSVAVSIVAAIAIGIIVPNQAMRRVRQNNRRTEEDSLDD